MQTFVHLTQDEFSAKEIKFMFLENENEELRDMLCEVLGIITKPPEIKDYQMFTKYESDLDFYKHRRNVEIKKLIYERRKRIITNTKLTGLPNKSIRL